MRTPRYPRSPMALNMTPMIDVVFQLLIFFVCTVEFERSEEVLPTRLPPVTRAGAISSPQEQDLGRIDVEVSREAVNMRFQGRTRSVPLGDVTELLTALQQQLRDWMRVDRRIPVRIAGKPDVATGTLLQVYDACLQTGAEDVGLVNRP